MMARVKILFFLTMLIWSCNVIKCGSIGLKSNFNKISGILQGDVLEERAAVGSSGQTNCGQYTRDNKAKYDKSCYYPYRSSTPSYCNYYVYFGNSSDATERIFEGNFKKPQRKKTPIEFRIKFNENNDDTIGYIFVEYTTGSKAIYDDDFHVLNGGIGGKHLNLKVRSDYEDPNEYKLVVYKKKPAN